MPAVAHKNPVCALAMADTVNRINPMPKLSTMNIPVVPNWLRMSVRPGHCTVADKVCLVC
jgi:hypothetical protein